MKKKSSIKSFSDLYEHAIDNNASLSIFIKGHLVIEFLLRKIVEISQPGLEQFTEGLNHYKIIELVKGLGHLTDDQEEALKLINQTRNKLAHQLSYEPSIDDLKLIFKKASKAFIDLTDGIEQGLAELERNTTVKDCDDWMLSELFIQISYDLHSIYHELGGDVELFN